MRRMMEFLNQHQLPLELAMPLYRTYGDVALEAVRSNPYLLSGWEFGVDFSQGRRPGSGAGRGGGGSPGAERLACSLSWTTT